MQLLGSVLFTVFLFVWTGAYAIFFFFAAALLPFRGRFALARVWSHVLLRVLKWTCRLDYRLEGTEHLPAGNHVALIKHSSSWETIAQCVILPPQAWVLKRELTWIPFLGWDLRLMRSIAVDRGAGGSAVRQVIDQGKVLLDSGVWIVIFPEGTRMAPGETRKYGLSGALLAREAGRLIVPVAHDAGYYWPRRGLRKRPGTIRVRIGPPIETAGREPREITAEAQLWIEANARPVEPAPVADAAAAIR
ncbi:MAG TPA: lysophospholipid acyltransferase family protein [Steroidobacteraceae bacterium]